MKYKARDCYFSLNFSAVNFIGAWGKAILNKIMRRLQRQQNLNTSQTCMSFIDSYNIRYQIKIPFRRYVFRFLF